MVGIDVLPINLPACLQQKKVKTENEIKAELVF